jgi:hypothetical protein
MSGYIGTQPVPQATQTRDSFTATSGQTSFATGGYTPNYLDVYLNGVKLASADYTATNGSDVVLASGAATGDILEVVAFTTFTPADLPAGTPSITDNGNATAITIDSNENVLIGTTDSNVANNSGSGNDGVSIQPDSVRIARTDGDMLLLNRLNSDGDIAKFLKDGTTVGSIKARYDYTTLQIGSTGTGITGTSSHKILPSVNNARSDNTNDLGDSSYRWKDLYISGAVYLGGVGSANKLEDYEEGTWTPVDGSGQVTLTDSPIGVYTKVGRQVTVIAYFAYPSTSQTNYAIVAGLPFTVSNYSNAMYAPGSIQTSYISSTNRHLAPLAYRNTNTFYFYDSELPLTNANLSGKNFRINITYFTDA